MIESHSRIIANNQLETDYNTVTSLKHMYREHDVTTQTARQSVDLDASRDHKSLNKLRIPTNARKQNDIFNSTQGYSRNKVLGYEQCCETLPSKSGRVKTSPVRGITQDDPYEIEFIS